MFPNPYYGCSPFYTFAIQNFPFLEKDFDALNDYQMMCQIFKYLDDKFKKLTKNMADFSKRLKKLKQILKLLKRKLTKQSKILKQKF